MAGTKGHSGPRADPAALHRLRGTYRQDRHGSQLELEGITPPSPPGQADDAGGSEALPPPAGLVKAERVYWHQFAPLLRAARILTPADVETLADYCRACVAIDDRGRRLRTALRKRVLEPALVRMLDQALRGWIDRKTRLAGELGLTAIARTRVAWSGHGQRLDPVQQPQSKLAQLQDQAAALRRPLKVQ